MTGSLTPPYRPKSTRSPSIPPSLWPAWPRRVDPVGRQIPHPTPESSHAAAGVTEHLCHRNDLGAQQLRNLLWVQPGPTGSPATLPPVPACAAKAAFSPLLAQAKLLPELVWPTSAQPCLPRPAVSSRTRLSGRRSIALQTNPRCVSGRVQPGARRLDRPCRGHSGMMLKSALRYGSETSRSRPEAFLKLTQNCIPAAEVVALIGGLPAVAREMERPGITQPCPRCDFGHQSRRQNKGAQPDHGVRIAAASSPARGGSRLTGFVMQVGCKEGLPSQRVA